MLGFEALRAERVYLAACVFAKGCESCRNASLIFTSIFGPPFFRSNFCWVYAEVTRAYYSSDARVYRQSSPLKQPREVERASEKILFARLRLQSNPTLQEKNWRQQRAWEVGFILLRALVK